MIERNKKTRRLDHSPLLSAADINVDEKVVSFDYDDQGRSIIKQYVDEVVKEQQEDTKSYQIKSDNNAKMVIDASGPVRAKHLLFSKGYHSACIASSAPALAESCETRNINPRNAVVKQYYANPQASPFWKHFDEMVTGDKKWEWILDQV